MHADPLEWAEKMAQEQALQGGNAGKRTCFKRAARSHSNGLSLDLENARSG